VDDLTTLLLYGTDDEIRAAADDPNRPKISAAEFQERLVALVKAFGLTIDEAAEAFRPPQS
jgi:hypothetical protein